MNIFAAKKAEPIIVVRDSDSSDSSDSSDITNRKHLTCEGLISWTSSSCSNEFDEDESDESAGVLSDSSDDDFNPWKAIDDLQAYNVGDDDTRKQNIRAYFARFSPGAVIAFKRFYKNMCDNFITHIDESDVFGEGQIMPQKYLLTVASYVIGLGRDTYNNLMAEPEMINVLVEHADVYSFDDLLPEEIRF